MLKTNKGTIQAWLPIPIIVGIVIVLLIGGGILAWQYLRVSKEEIKTPEEEVKEEEVTKDETADWKTYRNEEYNIELKYPKDLEVQESESDVYGKLLSFNLYSEENRIFGLTTADPEMEGHIRLYTIEGSEKEILVGGVKGSQFKKEDMKGEVPYIPQTLVKKYNRLYVFWGEGEIFDQILSSFRFIEVGETADWKTYKDEEIGIEFSYPKDWHFTPPKDWYVYFGEQEGKVLLGKELAVSPYTGERAPLYKIFKIISATPLEKALKFLKHEYDPSYYTIELQEKFNFQEKQAQKVLISCTAEYYVEQGIEAKQELAVITLDGYTGFIIPLSNRNPEYAYPFTKEQSNTFNQMLSTFRFLE